MVDTEKVVTNLQ